jgi:hypothetical protein
MSHITGTVQTLSPTIAIGPDSGSPSTSANTWLLNFSHLAAPGGTKLLILHFTNASFPASNRLEVDLGYDVDTFTSADGANFWTRPVNIHVLPGGLVPIRYITNGAATGKVDLDKYGRGESHVGEPGHPSISNCDPFLSATPYAEPTYDPFWYCANPPNWENVACIPSALDVRARVARSVGMIVSVEGSNVSTCSVTLVDADKVITAGHCHTPAEALTSSITFDYQTDCAGNRPGGYNARFHKVKASLEHRYDSGGDYSLLQLATSPAGIPAIQMRHDVPAAGEQVFGVHHPNGAIKKLSLPHPGFDTVLSSSAGAVNVHSTFHISGGSSGCGLFDAAGRIVGVLSNGDPCGKSGPATPLKYFPTAAILLDIAPAPPKPVTRDVMLVFDRSGSMSADDGTGRPKIDAARDAVSLFVQLVRSGTGNRVGLVSFSTAASVPADFNLAAVTGPNKTTLIGPAPYSGGKVGALLPGGRTSIGGGLDEARKQFPMPVTNPRAILLLTDGLQNEAPMINTVEGSFGTIAVHAIGFGTESSLDGTLLTNLATAHSGIYTRAGSGLALEKFFSHAFGNIFEAGILMDPEYFLPGSRNVSDPATFNICGEEAVTVVVGWDRTDTELLMQLKTPGGANVTRGSPGVEDATGRTWTFLRMALPHGGERDGVWSVTVFRPGGGEFPPPAVDLRYFINVIPTGGPKLVRMADSRRYYTGDFINPRVLLRYDDGSWPTDADVEVTVSRPDAAVGNVLSSSGLRPPMTVDGDVIPSRQATLMALEQASGHPVVAYTETNFQLADDAVSTGGAFEPAALFGKPFTDLLMIEGNYTFHFRARYGNECIAMRELLWSLHVDAGIDPGRTDVTTSVAGTCPEGRTAVRVVFIPRDKYGNKLGPGRLDGLSIASTSGTSVNGPVRDNGDGSYTIDLCWDAETSLPPGVIVTQPDRPPVEIPIPLPEGLPKFVYSVKFVCGVQTEPDCHCAPVRPGEYATEINIHNYLDVEVKIEKHVLPMVFAGAVAGREPRFVGRKASDRLVLPPHSATMDDCCRLRELLLGEPSGADVPLTIGFLEIISPRPINVIAVYTVTSGKSGAVSIDVEQIEGRRTT